MSTIITIAGVTAIIATVIGIAVTAIDAFVFVLKGEHEYED